MHHILSSRYPSEPLLSRKTFVMATFTIVTAVTLAGVLAGTQNWPVSTKAVAIFGVIVQLIAVRFRESTIVPQKRWRSWYAFVLGVLALFPLEVSDMHYGILTPEQETLNAAQVAVGLFWIFLILLSPVFAASLVRAKKSVGS